MEREHAVELGAAASVERERAAQPRIAGIGIGHDDLEAVGGAALDDEDEAALGRRAREDDARRGDQAAGADRGAARNGAGDRAGETMAHLLRNSGETSSSASAVCGLSARAIASVVASPSAPGSSCGPERARVDVARRRAPRCAAPARPGASARRARPSSRRCRRSRRASPAATPAGRAGSASARSAGRASSRQPRPRSDDSVHSHGVLNFGRRRLPGLGRLDQRAIDGAAGRRRCATNASASRSTSAGGGSSPAKWRASLVAMWRAVAGAAARSRRIACGLRLARLRIAACPAPCARRARAASAGRRSGPASAPWRAAYGRAEPADGPAGQRAREFGDVGLAVAAAHAERVQLQDLAREILVEAAPALRVEAGGALGQRRCRARSTAPGRDRAASPDAARPRAACPRSGRARAAGSPRLRTRRRAIRASACRPRPRNDWPRNAPAARRTAPA